MNAASLQRVLDGLAPPGVVVGHRVISAGDEAALLPPEVASMRSSLPVRRRASGAARFVARQLLSGLGYPSCAIPTGADGAPQWPEGIVGSLAHDDDVAVAAVALARDVAALGIDVEPAEPLPEEMLDLVVTKQERRQLGNDPLTARTLFAAKEAVYKAAYPGDRIFLEFHDIEVDLIEGRAKTKSDRVFTLRYCAAPRIVVLAFA
ncbi:MAG: 4'-phosphopantetheinyl transferase superfamily protein [Rhizobiales bacterium]|nr:4'-phosphopantetheinyl transferase superfamily protein [Hyphomicrobiales bacterium]